jgi:predicted RNase H-like HicB family nuclease
MERATYEIIDDPAPFYGEVPELQGVWATGKTLEECRKELQSVMRDGSH